MRELYRFKEASDTFLQGDSEGLRQAIEFGGLRPLIKFTGRGTSQDDREEAPVGGKSKLARWFGINADDATHGLAGYFYLSDGFALRLIEKSVLPDSNVYLYTDPECNPWDAFSVWLEDSNLGFSDLWFRASDLREVLQGEAKGEKASDDEVSTRERTTLYRVIAALAKEAKIDIAKNKGAPAVIEAAARGLFPDDYPKERTIRDILGRVREL